MDPVWDRQVVVRGDDQGALCQVGPDPVDDHEQGKQAREVPTSLSEHERPWEWPTGIASTQGVAGDAVATLSNIRSSPCEASARIPTSTRRSSHRTAPSTGKQLTMEIGNLSPSSSKLITSGGWIPMSTGPQPCPTRSVEGSR